MMSRYCPTIVIAVPALACMASCLHRQFTTFVLCRHRHCMVIVVAVVAVIVVVRLWWPLLPSF